MKALGWLWFAAVQLISGLAGLAGFAVLVLPCMLHAWELSTRRSLNDGRRIDRWTWAWLNPVWGNPEDGVSGLDALVWINGSTRRAYWPAAPSAALRAYVWSAVRNPANGLKYVFQWARGPYWSGTVLGLAVSAGWKVENGKLSVPVFSVHRA